MTQIKNSGFVLCFKILKKWVPRQSREPNQPSSKGDPPSTQLLLRETEHRSLITKRALCRGRMASATSHRPLTPQIVNLHMDSNCHQPRLCERLPTIATERLQTACSLSPLVSESLISTSIGSNNLREKILRPSVSIVYWNSSKMYF